MESSQHDVVGRGRPHNAGGRDRKGKRDRWHDEKGMEGGEGKERVKKRIKREKTKNRISQKT